MSSRLAAFITPGKTMAQAVERVQLAEKLGYESVWTTQIAQRDGLIPLAAYGAATTTIGLGTGVLPAFTRHPLQFAMEAATLDEVVGGRLIIGLGTSHKANMEGWYGFDMSKPLSQLKEYVGIVRSLITTGAVEHSGDFYTANFRFNGYTPRADIPVMISGLSPKTLHFAGEACDGVILWACLPSYIRDTIVPAVRAGEKAAGRPEGSCQIIAAVPVALADDLDAARNVFRKEFFVYMNLPFYRAAIAGAGYGDEIASFDAALAKGDMPGAFGAISDRMLAEFAGIGDAGVVRAKIAEYRAAGVTLPAAGSIGVPPEIGPGVEATLEAAIA
jgi:alkanesulfonate monooxygenase SsuD/methylene tetrahydromethanopterin reductase-like flavin-dependent oxidoreductase (luciferase family)